MSSDSIELADSVGGDGGIQQPNSFNPPPDEEAKRAVDNSSSSISIPDEQND